MKHVHGIPQYETLAELKDAYDSDKLSRVRDQLTLDNDASYVFTCGIGEFIAGEPVYHEVFEQHPEQLLREALDLLGIPWKEA